MRIAIVGPCAAGKTTLAHGLSRLGYDAVECAQEHSQAQRMWRQITRPELVIFLDASPDTIRDRLRVDWEASYLEELNRRLADVRAHADYYLDTDGLSEGEVLGLVLDYLRSVVGGQAT